MGQYSIRIAITSDHDPAKLHQFFAKCAASTGTVRQVQVRASGQTLMNQNEEIVLKLLEAHPDGLTILEMVEKSKPKRGYKTLGRTARFLAKQGMIWARPTGDKNTKRWMLVE